MTPEDAKLYLAANDHCPVKAASDYANDLGVADDWDWIYWAVRQITSVLNIMCPSPDDARITWRKLK